MTRIYSSLALAALLLLGAAALTAPSGGDRHALLGLLAAIGIVACHSLMFIYLIGTGKTIKAAVEAGRIDPRFAVEWKETIGLAIAPGGIGAATITAAAVVAGFATPAMRQVAHPALALAAVGVNAWALVREARVIARNRERVIAASAILARAPSTAASGDADAGALSGRTVFHALVLAGLTALGVYPYLRFVAREADASPFPFVPLGIALLVAGVVVRVRGRFAR